MTTTYTNRGYALQATGDNINSWGPILNANFSAIDENISGEFTITATGGTTTLTTSNAANVYFVANATLTSNLTIVFPVGRAFFFFTNSTTGAFTVTISAVGGGSTVVPVAGESVGCYTDGTNVVSVSNTTVAVAPVIPSGTILGGFLQSVAPVGWTQNTSYNDMVMRVTNDIYGGATGGSWVISGGTDNPYAITISQMPSHNHALSGAGISPSQTGSTGGYFSTVGDATGFTPTPTTFTGSGGTHQHGLTFDGSWRPAYVNSMVATKN